MPRELPRPRFTHDGRQDFERDDTPEETALRKLLHPAKHVRVVTPRVCATCTYGRIINGTFDCLRQDGFSADTGDLDHWYHVCDGYKVQE